MSHLNNPNAQAMSMNNVPSPVTGGMMHPNMVAGGNPGMMGPGNVVPSNVPQQQQMVNPGMQQHMAQQQMQQQHHAQQQQQHHSNNSFQEYASKLKPLVASLKASFAVYPDR